MNQVTLLEKPYDTASMVWSPFPRFNFNLKLLNEIKSLQNRIRTNDRLSFLILKSSVPNIFNLGGDLKFFEKAISTKDFGALKSYADLCIEVLYSHYTGLELSVTTVSLVQGLALGGGFEAALSSDVIIAEEQAKFGFPEVRFGLFPGMGAHCFLSRKISRTLSREIISSGAVYSAKQMYDAGLVDHLVKKGMGDEFLLKMISSNSNRTYSHFCQLKSEKISQGLIKRQELNEIADLWVENCKHLNLRDLELMSKLTERQSKLVPERGYEKISS